MSGTEGGISFPPGGAGVTDDTFAPVVLCDVAASGASTPFIRRLVFDPDTATVTKTDTALDGTTPYVVAGTVSTCTGSDTLVSTGVQALAASSTLDVKAAFPGVQSVSVIVRTGTCNATMTTGAAVPLNAGESVSWSVADSDDSSLAAASFTTAAASTALIVFTYKGTAAG